MTDITPDALPEAEPDERPQRRREYSGAGSTLGVAALIVVAVAVAIWWFELRGGDGGVLAGKPGLGIVVLPAEANATGQAPAARAGRPAPNFRLEGLDGTISSLVDYRGKWVIVNFWASWCGPCRAETPDLQALFDAHRDRLVVVGVNQQETKDTAGTFVKQFRLSYPVLLDRTGEVSEGYSVGRGLPVSLLLNPQGVVVRVILGRIPPDQLESIAREIGS
jgi:thiol-disulfide isomerase/thioredoxin